MEQKEVKVTARDVAQLIIPAYNAMIEEWNTCKGEYRLFLIDFSLDRSCNGFLVIGSVIEKNRAVDKYFIEIHTASTFIKKTFVAIDHASIIESYTECLKECKAIWKQCHPIIAIDMSRYNVDDFKAINESRLDTDNIRLVLSYNKVKKAYNAFINYFFT